MEKLNGLKRVLVLASVSPRRRGFLHQLGYSFEAVAPAVVERAHAGEAAGDYVLRNAREKAADVAERAGRCAVSVASASASRCRVRLCLSSGFASVRDSSRPTRQCRCS